jgi:hypothetical protein
MEAKRHALDEIAARQRAADEPGGNPAAADCGYFRTSTGSISAGRFTGQQPEVNSVYQGVSIPRHVRLQAFLQADTWARQLAHIGGRVRRDAAKLRFLPMAQ